MTRKRMTREEVANKLYQSEIEIVELKQRIEELIARSFINESASFGKGYQEAIQQLFEVIKEVFGKETRND